VLPHHDQESSDDRNQTEHGRMLSSNMLLLNLILLIDVTFSTPTPGFINGQSCSFYSELPANFSPQRIVRKRLLSQRRGNEDHH